MYIRIYSVAICGKLSKIFQGFVGKLVEIESAFINSGLRMDEKAILTEEYAHLREMTFTASRIGAFQMETGQLRTALQIQDEAMKDELRKI